MTKPALNISSSGLGDFRLSKYEAESIYMLLMALREVMPAVNTGDWFYDIPFKIEKQYGDNKYTGQLELQKRNIKQQEQLARIDEVQRAIKDRRGRSSIKIKHLDYLDNRLKQLAVKQEGEG